MFIFLALMCTESLEAGTLLLVIIEIHLVGVVSSKSSAVLVFIHLNTAIKSKGTHKFSGVYKVQSEGRKKCAYAHFSDTFSGGILTAGG